jgi:hypothetical protein
MLLMSDWEDFESQAMLCQTNKKGLKVTVAVDGTSETTARQQAPVLENMSARASDN